MEKLLIAVLWFLSVLVAGLIGFMASYLKKKGENLATHEDIDMLVEQVTAVTAATKEIEAKISSDVWDRQRRWEMKRDVLSEATRRLGGIQDALMNLSSSYQANQGPQSNPASQQAVERAVDKWEDESRKFEESCLLIGIVCGEDVEDACNDLLVTARQIAGQLFVGNVENAIYSLRDFVNKYLAAKSAIRHELGF